MFGRIIFCSAVSAATIAVILLAVASPVSQKKRHSGPWLDLSLYMQQPGRAATSNSDLVPREEGGALIFRRVLTEGPENTSRVVGKAQGFVIPTESGASLDVIYLSFDTAQHSGSLSVEVGRDKEELKVIGGTGSFAFARGLALFTKTDSKPSQVPPTYHLKLQLQFPNRS